MAARLSLDTNILLYAEGIDDAGRQAKALDVLSATSSESFAISVQVIGELFNVLIKRRVAREVAQKRALYWKQTLSVVDTSDALMETAIDLAAQHKMRVWDAVILSAAAEARCDFLLSEDFQDGFVWRGVTVANPFAAKPHPFLTALLRT